MSQPIGVYPFSHAGDYTGDQFNAWLGVPAVRRKAYLPYWDPSKPTEGRWPAIVASIPILKRWLPWSSGSPVSINMGLGGPLKELADNKVDPATGKKPTDYITEMAKAISAAVPASQTVIDAPLLWEDQGFWYSWASLGQESEYKTAFQRYSRALKAVDSRFFVWWCITTTQWVRDGGNNVKPINPMNSYPGDADVDGWAVDCYRYPSVRPAGTSGPIDSPDDATVWSHRLNDPYGMAWWNAKADSHSKSKRIAELGAAIDAPVFYESVLTWAATHGVGIDLFNTSDGRDDFTISTGLYPKSAAVFKAHFGA